jgi:hypothetical protein
LQQHSTQLSECVRADIVERPEDALAIFDRDCDDLALERERLLERGARRLVHELDEIANVLVRDRQAGEIHDAGGTTRWGRDS